jgi:hypothetical protein
LWGARVVAFAGLLAVGSGLLCGEASASGPGAPAIGFANLPSNAFDQSRCAAMSVARHIVFAGQDEVAQAGPAEPGSCGGGTVSWLWSYLYGTIVRGCGRDDATCVFKAEGSTNGSYVALCVDGSSTFGPWDSCDYYGVVGAGVGVIDGYVKDKDGDAVGGVAVRAGGAHGTSATTGPDGYYAMQLDAGDYRVVPSGGPQGKTRPTYDPETSDAHVVAGSTTGASFRLDAGLEVKLHFDQDSVPADGMQVVNGTITTSELGKPVGNVAVMLTVMPGEAVDATVKSGPRASICSDGNRVWPTGSLASPDGVPVDVTTDGNGQYDFSLTVGTTPGTWRLDAWAKNSDGTLSLDTSEASDTAEVSFSSLGSASPPSFVGELDLVARTTRLLEQLSSSPGGAVSTLAQVTGAHSGGGRLGGLAYAVTNAKDGQAVLVFPADAPPSVNDEGVIDPALTRNADDLVIDPAEWTGEGLAKTLTDAASLQSVLDAGLLPDAPTLEQFDAGATVKAWKTVRGNQLSVASQSFEYLGWGYPGIAAPGSCY